jgi:hypothetical protein
MSQLESALSSASSAASPAKSSVSAPSSYSPSQIRVPNLVIELSSIRCDVTPGAARLIQLLNVSGKFVAEQKWRDAAEAGQIFLCYVIYKDICLTNYGKYVLQIFSVDSHCVRRAALFRVPKCFDAPSVIC